MSIQALNDLNKELNRIAIAGVNLSKGDYRINNLIPILKKSGETVPVFSKIALLAEKLISEDENERTSVFLDLLSLETAVLSTLAPCGVVGKINELEGHHNKIETNISYRKLKPVMSALEESGSGRGKIIEEAYKEGILYDIRIVPSLIKALSDSYFSNDFIINRLVDFGEFVIPILKNRFDINESNTSSKIIKTVSRIAKAKENEWYKSILNLEPSEDIIIEVIDALKYSQDNLELVIEYTMHKKKPVRLAAFTTLGYFNDTKATDIFFKAFDRKDRDIIKYGVKENNSIELVNYIISKIKESFSNLLSSDIFKESLNNKTTIDFKDSKDVSLIYDSLDILSYKKNEDVFNLYQDIKNNIDDMLIIEAPKSSDYKFVADLFVDNLLTYSTKESLSILKEYEKYDYFKRYAFLASVIIDDPKEVYNTYSKIIKKDSKGKGLGIVDAFYFLSLGKRDSVFMKEFNKVYQKLDIRWLDLFIDLDNLNVVLFLADKSSKKLGDYLITKVKEAISKKNPPWEIIKVLLEIDYKPQGVISLIETMLKNQYWYIDYSVMKLFSSKYASDIEKLGVKYNNEKIIDVALYLKNKIN